MCSMFKYHQVPMDILTAFLQHLSVYDLQKIAVIDEYCQKAIHKEGCDRFKKMISQYAYKDCLQ